MSAENVKINKNVADLTPHEKPNADPTEAHGEHPPTLDIFEKVVQISDKEPLDGQSEKKQVDDYFEKNADVKKEAESGELDIITRATPRGCWILIGAGIALAATAFGAKVYLDNRKNKEKK